MKKNILWLCLSCVLLFLQALVLADQSTDEIFPEPDIIKDNVAFWRKIYSEISIKEGLLHDRDHPLVIYETIDLTVIPPGQRYKFINTRKDYYSDIIKKMTKDSSQQDEKARIYDLFKTYATIEDIEGAKDRIRFQLGQKERFMKGLERSYIYLDTISAILKKYGLPNELKYLPHVESSFDPQAYSRVGAAGMWQFMRSTGKLFMNIDYNIDERLDPIIAADAAARLLNLNYQHLLSWPLAITAYNHGLQGMKNAISTTGTNNIAVILEKHESPTFKFASKNFYASFLAAKQLADSALHLFPDIKPMKPIPRKSLMIPDGLTPDKFCQIAGIPLDVFKQYNPAIRPSVYIQKKPIPSGYAVSLPDSVETQKILAALDQNWQARSGSISGISDYYTVQKGDNLTSIAHKFAISPESLASINSIPQIHNIYEGQVLRIPATVKETIAYTPEDSNIQNIDSTDENQMDELYTEVVPELLSDVTPLLDSLADSSLNVSRAINADSPSTIKIPDVALDTQNLLLKEETYSYPFDASIYDLGLKLAPGGSSAAIKVNIGESIIRYAEWMNVKVAAILRVNDMKNYRLRLGKQIIIPVSSKSDLKKFQTNRLEHLMAIEEDFYSRYQITDTTTYTLKKGDSFGRISSLKGIPLWLLKKTNRSIDFSVPHEGMKIKIPGVVARDNHEQPLLEDSPSGIPVLQKETFEHLEEVKE